MRYVENNPVRAKMVRKAWEYNWSSAVAHTGGRDTAAILSMAAWRRLATDASWEKYLTEKEDPALNELIRAKTNRGRPLGSDSFISKLEKMAGRRLRPLPHGRPRKENG
jgi:putative transposase